ncbi:MAG: hypothetical protein IT460_18355 [Planctomycetes bacterium]|nr:hypothetical protein [Planctomycetota bacterium]
MATRIFGMVLLVLGAARLAWPPPTGTTAVHAAAAAAEVAIGLLCARRATARLGLGLAVTMLSSFAVYNLVRVVQGGGAQTCGCHARIWDATHSQTLVFTGGLLAWATFLVTRDSSQKATRNTRLIRVAPGAALLVAIAALLLPPQERELPPPSGDGKIDQSALVHSGKPSTLLARGVPQPPPEPPHAPVVRSLEVTARTLRGETIEGVAVWWEGTGRADDLASATDVAGVARVGRPDRAGRIVGRTIEGIWATSEVAADAARAELRFDDSVSLRGTTVDLDGSPVGGISLLVRGRGNDTSDSPRPDFADRYERASVKSGADGRFELRGFSSGLVTIVATDPSERVVADNNGVLVVKLPSADVSVRVMPVRVVSLRFVDADSSEPVAPPYVVRMTGREASGLLGVVENAMDRVLLHLPASRFRTGSILSIRAGGFDHPPQDRSLELTESDDLAVPLRREVSGRAVGNLEIELPRGFARAGSWDLLYMAQPGSRAGVRRTILESDGKWVVLDMAVGRYDVFYMGKRIATSVTISEHQTTRIAGDFGDFAPLRIRPLVAGSPARGTFHVAVHPEGDDMWGNSTIRADDSGVLAVGWFPVGSVDVTQVFRSNLRIESPVRFQLSNDEVQRDLVGDVSLIPQ